MKNIETYSSTNSRSTLRITNAEHLRLQKEREREFLASLGVPQKKAEKKEEKKEEKKRAGVEITTKRDIYGDGRSEGLARALRTAEGGWQLKNAQNEVGAVFSADGKLLFSNESGGHSNVSIPVAYQNGNIVTHYHPSMYYDLSEQVRRYNGGKITNNIAMRIGQSLSRTDLVLASVNRAKEIRAVAPNYVYSMRPNPKKGWGVNTQQDYQKLKRVYDKYYNQYTERYKNENMPKTYSSAERLTQVTARRQILAEEYAARMTAKEFGWIYQRHKIK